MSIAVGFYTVKDLNDFLNLPLNVKYYELDVPQALKLFEEDYDEEVIREIVINPKMKEYIEKLFTHNIYGKEARLFHTQIQKIILQEHLNGNLNLKLNLYILEACIKLYDSDNTAWDRPTDLQTKNLITDYIANCINSKNHNLAYNNPILYISSFAYGPDIAFIWNLIPKLDNPSQYLKDEKGRPIEILKPFYKAAMSKELIDTSLAFRGSGLPSLAIENIASHAYDTSGMQLHEIMNIVSNITERPNPGVVGATADTFDEQEYIDV